MNANFKTQMSIRVVYEICLITIPLISNYGLFAIGYILAILGIFQDNMYFK